MSRLVGRLAQFDAAPLSASLYSRLGERNDFPNSKTQLGVCGEFRLVESALAQPNFFALPRYLDGSRK